MYCVFPYKDLVYRSFSEKECETNLMKTETDNESYTNFK